MIKFLIWFFVSQMILTILWFPYYYSTSKIGRLITLLNAVLVGSVASYFVLKFFYKTVVIERGTKYILFCLYFVLVCILGVWTGSWFPASNDKEGDNSDENGVLDGKSEKIKEDRLE